MPLKQKKSLSITSFSKTSPPTTNGPVSRKPSVTKSPVLSPKLSPKVGRLEIVSAGRYAAERGALDAAELLGHPVNGVTLRKYTLSTAKYGLSYVDDTTSEESLIHANVLHSDKCLVLGSVVPVVDVPFMGIDLLTFEPVWMSEVVLQFIGQPCRLLVLSDPREEIDLYWKARALILMVGRALHPLALPTEKR